MWKCIVNTSIEYEYQKSYQKQFILLHYHAWQKPIQILISTLNYIYSLTNSNRYNYGAHKFQVENSVINASFYWFQSLFRVLTSYLFWTVSFSWKFVYFNCCLFVCGAASIYWFDNYYQLFVLTLPYFRVTNTLAYMFAYMFESKYWEFCIVTPFFFSHNIFINAQAIQSTQ